jgi:6,7-dimethyl-8-ribityllumazine synthase
MQVGCVFAARFNDFIVERLLAGAIDTLVKHGANVADIDVVRVPGAFEMPLAVNKLAAYVAGEASRGIGQAGLAHNVPVGFGLLTVETIEQAIERAGTKAGNKGVDAAMSAIEMATLLRQLES